MNEEDKKESFFLRAERPGAPDEEKSLNNYLERLGDITEAEALDLADQIINDTAPGVELRVKIIRRVELLETAALRAAPPAVLRRLVSTDPEGRPWFTIRGERTEGIPSRDTRLEFYVETVLVSTEPDSTEPEGKPFFVIPYPPCPDCGGEIRRLGLERREGQFPGTRGCPDCGSLFADTRYENPPVLEDPELFIVRADFQGGGYGYASEKYDGDPATDQLTTLHRDLARRFTADELDQVKESFGAWRTPPSLDIIPLSWFPETTGGIKRNA